MLTTQIAGKPSIFAPGIPSKRCPWCRQPWSSRSGLGAWCVVCNLIVTDLSVADPVLGPRGNAIGHRDIAPDGTLWTILHSPPVPFCPRCGEEWTAMGERGAVCVPCLTVAQDDRAMTDKERRAWRDFVVKAGGERETTRGRKADLKAQPTTVADMVIDIGRAET